MTVSNRRYLSKDQKNHVEGLNITRAYLVADGKMYVVSRELQNTVDKYQDADMYTTVNDGRVVLYIEL